jgi:hypothetical protein
MKLCIQVAFLAIFVSTMVAFGQSACGTTASPAACPEDSFQIKYASNLAGTGSAGLGDSLINATNTGAQAGTGGFIGFTGGNLCLNFYVFDPNEEELACCSCAVTPNALVSTTVRGILLSNNWTPEAPTSAVIKVLATNQPASGSCATAAQAAVGGVIVPGTPNQLASGARIWGTTLHTFTGAITGTPYGTETEFSHAGSTLSQGELNRMVNLCIVAAGNGSGFGICQGAVTPTGAHLPACATGGLGAVGN